MQKTIMLRLLPSEAADESAIKNYIGKTLAVPAAAITGFYVQRKSIDARGKQAWVQLSLLAFVNEPYAERPSYPVSFPDVRKAAVRVLIIGAGPAGLFAALQLIEKGIRPIILERGKDVRARRRDLALLNKEGIVDPDSNYCFGEGGAGTYSDGKLYTRSSKRGDINRILHLLHYFGAGENILYEAHPHIGTNKLPGIITAIRQTITDRGGEFYFEQRVTGLDLSENRIRGVRSASGNRWEADAVILATGHSARDIFQLLEQKKIYLEAKPFALGVRVEHPQAVIDRAQYHCLVRDPDLPPAAYSLVQQVENRGVFSFCMCPGGIIAPAATTAGELVVNGWSPSKRNNPYANSGMVVEIKPSDIFHLKDIRKITGMHDAAMQGPLSMMYFQQYVERKAFDAGGGKFVAPAQRMTDFCENKKSSSLPSCSYIPGVQACALSEVLPRLVNEALQQAFRLFGKKMKGYYSEEAIVVATESRTSSPVRIPRDPVSLQHPQLENLYPCGEGAGYAGGIVSAAMDGERIACVIAEKKTGRL